MQRLESSSQHLKPSKGQEGFTENWELGTENSYFEYSSRSRVWRLVIGIAMPSM